MKLSINYNHNAENLSETLGLNARQMDAKYPTRKLIEWINSGHFSIAIEKAMQDCDENNYGELCLLMFTLGYLAQKKHAITENKQILEQVDKLLEKNIEMNDNS